MGWLYPQKQFKIINYGYAAETEDGKFIDLSPEDEPDRMGLQMYHYLATSRIIFFSKYFD